MRCQRALDTVGDLGASRVAVAGLEVNQILLDQRQHFLGRLEQLLQGADQGDQLTVFVLKLAAFERGQAAQLHVEDRLRLDLGKLELTHQALLGSVNGLRGADQGDDFVKHVERAQQALHDVRAGLRLLQLEFAAAEDHLLTVFEEVHQHALEAQQPRFAVHQRQH